MNFLCCLVSEVQRFVLLLYSKGVFVVWFYGFIMGSSGGVEGEFAKGSAEFLESQVRELVRTRELEWFELLGRSEKLVREKGLLFCKDSIDGNNIHRSIILLRRNNYTCSDY